jgi:chromosome segregation ATPase
VWRGAGSKCNNLLTHLNRKDGYMPNATKKAASSNTDKPKRKTLSATEKVARLEAELAAAREAANEKNAKQAQLLKQQRAKLQAQVDERKVKIASIDTELERLDVPVTETDESPDPIVGPEGQQS